MSKLASRLSVVVFLVVFLPLAFRSATSPNLADRDVRSFFMIALVAVVVAAVVRGFLRLPLVPRLSVAVFAVVFLLSILPALKTAGGLNAPILLAATVVAAIATVVARVFLRVVLPGPTDQSVRGLSPVTPSPPVTRSCPTCAAPLAADAPQGLCPRCLLKQAFAPPPVATAAYRPDIPPSPEEVAEFLPHLHILELVGQGGMGAVYKARQPALDRLVALKLIRPRDDDPTFAERFMREAKALARLDHPHVVRIHESGTAGGCLYLVMEFVDGVTLRQAMQAKSLTSAQMLVVIGQLCDALQYAHRKGVVHRDVKPENVLLDKAGKAKVADFGLAKVIDPAGMSLTRTNQAMGTPHYMAPEQWEAAGAVDHRADIYALGVLLYEMLTGELPLGRFDPPSVKARIDARIDDVVLRALAKEPGRRYQNADDVRTALNLIRDTEPPPGANGVPPRFYEYKSKTAYLGWPLVHIVSGLDPTTGKPKVARGWIAVGDSVAVGGVAVAGAMAFGGVAVAGGGSVGVVSLAGGWSAALLLAMAGGAAVGSVAVAGGAAVGLLAVASASCGFWAVGAKAAGFHVLDSKRQDADFWDTLTGWF